MLSFGVSMDFWTMVAARCAQGVFNGNIGVAKTVIAEITDPRMLADAYAMMPLVWSLGSTLGPILGGILADPAKRWPDIFGKLTYFTLHPYFLPCAAAGFSTMVIFVIAVLGLKESLPLALSERKQNTACVESPLLDNDTPTYGSTSLSRNERSTQAGADAPMSFSGLLIPQVLTPLLVYTFLSFVDMGMQVLLPLMYSTSISIGGLGFDAYRIGVILSIFGFVNAFVQFFFLGHLVRRFGPRNLLALTQLSNAVNIGLYPLLSFFVRRAGRADGIVWAIIVLQLISRLTAGMGWGSIQLLIVDSAPNRASLGATNGMGQAVGCIARSVGPSVASSLFSLSLERNLVGGCLVYLVLVGFALLGLGITYMLPRKLRSLTN
ncbi:Protein ZINC INDUCED FACILITATOR-LIKE 1 [Termitomyces sp. J132]|nr:Protein ZINC INDUCED FACILITATOR-LIKE 1 [Termitomyces sp. J132]